MIQLRKETNERKKVKHDDIRHNRSEVKKQNGNHAYSKIQTRPT